MVDDPALLASAQALRYRVFVEELGASGPMVDHDRRLERDSFDEICDHMLLIDDAVDQVVGVYRLIRPEHAAAAGRYYSEDEYDVSVLKSSGRRLLELGRSCLHQDYRGGAAMYHLWNGLAAYVEAHKIDVLFGVASFPGTDVTALAEPLSVLHHRFLAPPELRPKARGAQGVPMDILPAASVDRRKAMVRIPALIKGYLRLGGVVGQGAWIDHDFNTTDVCLVLDTAQMNARRRSIYANSQ